MIRIISIVESAFSCNQYQQQKMKRKYDIIVSSQQMVRTAVRTQNPWQLYFATVFISCLYIIADSAIQLGRGWKPVARVYLAI